MADREPRVTQSDLADGVSVSQSAVNKWLNGTIPGGAELRKIAQFFSVPTDFLLGINLDSFGVTATSVAGVIAEAAPVAEDDRQQVFSDLLTALIVVRSAVTEARASVIDCAAKFESLEHQLRTALLPTGKGQGADRNTTKPAGPEMRSAANKTRLGNQPSYEPTSVKEEVLTKIPTPSVNVHGHPGNPKSKP